MRCSGDVGRQTALAGRGLLHSDVQGTVVVCVKGSLPKSIQVSHEGKSPPIPSDVILSDLAVDFKDRCFAV